jgi:pyridinium-3,5-biscarboxylic acid mononucleotide sulfurtransferase
MEIENKLEKIKDCFKDKRVVVAFSGGADSTLLAKLALDNATEAVAVTVDNGVLPADCITQSSRIAAEIGISQEIIRVNFLEDDSFRTNPPQRCYICKNKMYSELEKFLKATEFDVIVDGTNISDLMEDRPGIMVAYQKNILMPLVYGGMNAEEVRTGLKVFNIEYSPSTTCYATRISTGIELNPKKISRIEYAENIIKNITGLNVVRVRDEDNTARIEVSDPDKLLDTEILSHINSELTSIGFEKVNPDIGVYGYKDSDIIIYKPCRDEANKIMFDIELPYHLDIQQTCQQLEKVGEVKCSHKMGIVMIELDGSNVTIFKKGKIVARRVKDEADARLLMNRILPLIRRDVK